MSVRAVWNPLTTVTYLVANPVLMLYTMSVVTRESVLRGRVGGQHFGSSDMQDYSSALLESGALPVQVIAHRARDEDIGSSRGAKTEACHPLRSS